MKQSLLPALICSILILLGASESLAGSPGTSRVVVEIDAKAETAVKARLTRRLIALEIGEVGVPPAPEPRSPLATAVYSFAWWEERMAGSGLSSGNTAFSMERGN